ncbi:MAG TPA: hypothetical protein VLI90_20785 [Tepidisphaeraceae bacterium]|nr:hypothetical protein [Tepidisphaeraceae bacterium]
MTVRLELPADVEQRLLAEVRAGRHGSIEEAILEKLSRDEDVELMGAMGMDAAQIRSDLDEAWANREGAVDGQTVFARIAAKSASCRAQGK